MLIGKRIYEKISFRYTIFHYQYLDPQDNDLYLEINKKKKERKLSENQKLNEKF